MNYEYLSALNNEYMSAMNYEKMYICSSNVVRLSRRIENGIHLHCSLNMFYCRQQTHGLDKSDNNVQTPSTIQRNIIQLTIWWHMLQAKQMLQKTMRLLRERERDRERERERERERAM